MMEGFILSDLQAFLYLTTYLIHAELIYEKNVNHFGELVPEFKILVL